MKLIKIDLTKCFSKKNDGVYHDHPDINIRKWYLAKIGDGFYTGKFTRIWYGWSFDGWENDIQLDKPGTNGSLWKGLWELVQSEKRNK